MTFRVTFADGSAEVVNASSVEQARMDAIKLFPDRIVAKVTPAGLGDLMVRRRPTNLIEAWPRNRD